MEHVVLFPLPFPSFSSSSSSSSSSSISVSVFWLFFFLMAGNGTVGPVKTFLLFPERSAQTSATKYETNERTKTKQNKTNEKRNAVDPKDLGNVSRRDVLGNESQLLSDQMSRPDKAPKENLFFLVQRKKQRRYDPLANPEPPSSYVGHTPD